MVFWFGGVLFRVAGLMLHWGNREWVHSTVPSVVRLGCACVARCFKGLRVLLYSDGNGSVVLIRVFGGSAV